MTITKTINFAKGHPNRSLVPTDAIQTIFSQMALTHTKERLSSSLNYGDEEGDSDFSHELKEFLERHCQNDESPDYNTPDTTFFATHGVSHGVELICATLTNTDDLVLVENPTYFLVAGIFAAHKLRVETLPMTENGIDCEAFQEKLSNGMRPKLVYLIPSHQNPTARTMPLQERLAICRLAEIYHFTIIADEVYHLLDWGETRPARFSSLSPNALSVSSFTKIFAPGVRCGWIEGPPETISTICKYGYIRSQGGCVPFVGNIMRTAMNTRLADEVLIKLNAAYSRRVNMLVKILEQECRLEITTRPSGGYFLWVRLFTKEHEMWTASDFLEFSSQRGISFLSGETCDPSNSGRLSQFARLCFAYLDEADLKEGAELFVTLYRMFCDETKYSAGSCCQ